MSWQKKNNLYLGNAPDTFLGGGGQKTRSIIDSGDVGKIILGNFIFAFPGVEPWHPSPEPWFQKGGGPVIDMGPYFFTMLVHLLGPAKSVNSQATKITDYRVIGSGQKKGKKFDVEIPTSYMITLTFQNNSIMHGFLSFDVVNHNRNHMEFYGTKGSIIGPDPNMFGGPILASFSEGGQWQEFSTEDMPLGKTNIFSQSSRSNESPKNANYRGIGLSEMIFCIENKKIHRCNGDLSLHVLDIIDSTILSAQTSEEKEMRTTCTRPDYFSDEEIKKLLK